MGIAGLYNTRVRRYAAQRTEVDGQWTQDHASPGDYFSARKEKADARLLDTILGDIPDEVWLFYTPATRTICEDDWLEEEDGTKYKVIEVLPAHARGRVHHNEVLGVVQ
jgi:hypothetical protein